MAVVEIGDPAVAYDSFATVAFADEYLAADVSRADAWAALSAASKGRALVSATRMMLALPWCDVVPDPTVDQAEPIPSVAAMLAADLAAKPKLFADASGSSNIKSVKAGSVAVEFFTPVDGGPPLPLQLWNLLLAADLVCLGSSESAANEGPWVSGVCEGTRPLGGRYPWDWPIAEADYDG